MRYNVKVSFKGYDTKPIYISSDAQKLKEVIEMLPSISELDVTNTLYDDGVEWIFTFLGNVGDQPIMQIETSYLKGHYKSPKADEVVQGSLPLFSHGSESSGEKCMSNMNLKFKLL